MTVVANRRAVPVTAVHIRVRHARPVSIRLRMAHDARESRVVRRIYVAVRAHRAIMRNAEPGVISRR